MATKDSKAMLSAAALAESWDTSVARLANLRSLGSGPSYVKIGSRVLYKLSDIERFEDRYVIHTRESVAV